MRFLFLLAALFSAAPLSAAAFTVEATGQGYGELILAVSAIGDGDGTILIAPGHYAQCAIQTAGRITYRAVRPQTAIFDGMICEGKAALVLRGRGATVDGLVFRNMRVPDGNGAGIRIERGALIVKNSIFRDSEEGILGAADDPTSTVRIERSTFSGLGRCDRGLSCAHSIYLAGIKSVTVLRSRFERGTGGHYVKSRAAQIEVSDCSFDDSHGHATNYMIDLPAGATGIIHRNVFVQGADKENHSAFIAVAAESQTNPSAGLEIRENQAHQVAGVTWPSALVADWSHSPMVIKDNIVGGNVTLTSESHPPGIGARVKGALRKLVRG